MGSHLEMVGYAWFMLGLCHRNSEFSHVFPLQMVILRYFNNLAGWWCNNHLEKYEFVNGKDDIPYMKRKIKAMFETTNQDVYGIVYGMVRPTLTLIHHYLIF